MATLNLQSSQFLPGDALHSFVVEAGEPFLIEILKGQVVRIVDLEGNQAVELQIAGAKDLPHAVGCGGPRIS